MSKKVKSFSRRLTRSVVLTVFIIMVTISMLVFLTTASGIFALSKEHFADILDKTNLNVTGMMNKVEVSAYNILDEIEWHVSSPEVVKSTLEYEMLTNNHLDGVGVAFIENYFPAKGKWFDPYATVQGDSVVVREIGSATHDYFSSEWFTLGLNSPQGTWSNPYFDSEGAGDLLSTYLLPVHKEPERNVVGVVGTDLTLSHLQAFVDELDRTQNEDPILSISEEDKDLLIYSFVIGPDGNFIIHPDKSRILDKNFFDFVGKRDTENYMALGKAMIAGERGDMEVYIDGHSANVFYAPLMSSGWSMGIVVPSMRLLLPALIFGSLILLLIFFGLLVIALICRYRIRRTTAPLIKLADSAKEVAKGNFGTELPKIKSDDEIGLLRDSFDHMQQSLSKYINELTETTKQKASIENELYLAREIQMSLIPKIWPAFPDRKEIDIFGSVSPAKVVGGDLFDFNIKDGKLFFCIGDVSGKGVPASLVMMLSCAMFRMLASSGNHPDGILSSMNTLMSQQNDNIMFVTLFIGVLDLSTGELEYSNAGHNEPVIVENGKPRYMDADPNIALGIVPDWKFSLHKATMNPGDVLFLYTDGLTEATRSDNTLFGEARLYRILSGEIGGLSAHELVQKVSEAVGNFVGDADQSDDLTMLAIKLANKAK